MIAAGRRQSGPMMPKKFLIAFVLISLAGHALVLALTNGIHWSPSPREAEVMTVEFKPDPVQSPRPEPRHAPAKPTRETGPGLLGEDSVSLQEPGSRYDVYLQAIRRRIENLWIYPPQAMEQRQEGNAQIRFTINANGSVSDYRIVTSSGSPILDRGALAVVQDAAPYAPLPADFRLERLHITAVFSYRLNP